MMDFFTALVICAFDVEAAKKMTDNGAKPLREVVNDILEEAGLDAVEKVQSEPGRKTDG
ncbi:MAG: hypothetical protein J6S60_07335 [Oscillospiraceae bacterium]|nr:hypothetical protein [Oscillospiraceae bacterium]